MKEVELMNLEIRDVNAHEATEIVTWDPQKKQAPTDLTFLIDNDLDQQVSVQAVGGKYVDGIGWEYKTNVGTPVVLAADTDGHLGVYPDNPYMPDYGVIVTAAVQPTVHAIKIKAVYVVDQ